MIDVDLIELGVLGVFIGDDGLVATQRTAVRYRRVVAS